MILKILFHVLYFLRPVKKFFLGLGTLLLIFIIIFELIAGEIFITIFPFLGIFLLHLIGFYYDVLILKLKPEDLDITLY